jgi:hypothetical protein
MRTEGEPATFQMGRIRGMQVRVPGVQIAGPESITTVWLIDTPDKQKPPGVDGYLGPASLGAQTVEFDFDAKVLRWQ